MERRLFFGLFLVYIAFAGGHLYTADDWSRYYSARGFLLSLSPEVPDRPYVYGTEGRNGLRVSHFPPGLSMASLPLLGIGHLGGLPFPRRQELMERMSLSLFNQIIMPVVMVLLYRLMRKAGQSDRRNMSMVLIAAFGSLAFPYAKHYWAEPLQVALLLGALLQLQALRSGENGPSIYFAFSALLAGGVLVKYEAMLPAVILTAILFVRSFPKTRYGLLSFLAPWIVAALILGGYNFWRFGSALNFGYGGLIFHTSSGIDPSLLSASLVPAPRSMANRFLLLLFSSGAGLIIFVPLCAIAMAVAMVRRPGVLRPSFACGFGLFFLYVFLDRSSTWCWGPRYLFPSMILWWPALALIGRGRSVRLIIGVLAAAGIFVALLGVLVNFHDGIEEIKEERGYDGWEWVAHVQKEPSLSPLWWHAKLLPTYFGRTIDAGRKGPEPDDLPVLWRHRRIDMVWTTLWAGGAPWVVLLFPGFCLVFAYRQLITAWRSLS